MLVDKSLYPKIHLRPEDVEYMQQHSIFLFEPNTDKYVNDEEIIGSRKISAKLLIDLIEHEDSLEYVTKLFNGEISSFTIYFVSSEGEYRRQMSFNKKELVEYLEKIVFNLTPKQFELFQHLTKKVSFESLVEEKGNDIFNIDIERINYNFKVGDLLGFLTLEENEFMSYMFDENGTYKGIPITHFLYAIKEYFSRKYIESEYFIYESIKTRLDSIKESKYIDIDAINHNLENNDYNFEEIEVNEELKQLIIKDMPSYLTPLEKAIYIYIKMCKVLTYDEEFYAVNQRGLVADRHEEVSNVKKITPKNNRVVCYEFNAIFEKMIYDYGIISDVDQKLVNGFGGGHASLVFRDGKFLISADAVTGILQGDIMQAKLNQPLQGLTCKNRNSQTRQEFQQSLQMVYSLIASQEKQLTSNEVGTYETFEDILRQYSEMTENLKSVSLEEKMQILMAKIEATQLTGIDGFSYILQLRKELFTEHEQKANFKVSIIRENTPDEEKIAKPKAIMALRVPTEEGHLVRYFVYYPNEPLVEVSLEQLQKKFDEREFEYIDRGDPRMPGIDEGGPKK